MFINSSHSTRQVYNSTRTDQGRTGLHSRCLTRHVHNSSHSMRVFILVHTQQDVFIIVHTHQDVFISSRSTRQVYNSTQSDRGRTIIAFYRCLTRHVLNYSSHSIIRVHKHKRNSHTDTHTHLHTRTYTRAHTHAHTGQRLPIKYPSRELREMYHQLQ